MVHFVLFNSIHDALKAERILKEQSVEGEIVPVPRALSSDCGVCIKSDADGQVLAGLLSGLRGARCFVQNGTEYKPGSSLPQ